MTTQGQTRTGCTALGFKGVQGIAQSKLAYDLARAYPPCIWREQEKLSGTLEWDIVTQPWL